MRRALGPWLEQVDEVPTEWVCLFSEPGALPDLPIHPPLCYPATCSALSGSQLCHYKVREAQYPRKHFSQD